MNKKVGQTAGGESDHQGTALSNIPGPKAPPKFNSIFLADSSSSQPSRRYDLTSAAPSSLTSNQSVNATPKSSIRSSSLQPTTTQTFKVNAPPPPKTNSSPQSTSSQTRNSRLPVIIDENFTETDVNRLPRQNTVEEFISAIDDVTKRNDLIMDRTKDDFLREERASEKTTGTTITTQKAANDPDIDYLLKEVERREKRQRELDYKIKLNERRLSEKYRKMARDDLSTKRASSLVRSGSPEKSKRKSVTIAEDAEPMDDTNRKIEENKLKRETLIRKLAGYDELETKKKQRLSEQEKELKLEESDKLIAEGASMLASSKTSDNGDCSQQPATKKRIAPRIEPKRETLVKKQLN